MVGFEKRNATLLVSLLFVVAVCVAANLHLANASEIEMGVDDAVLEADSIGQEAEGDLSDEMKNDESESISMPQEELSDLGEEPPGTQAGIQGELDNLGDQLAGSSTAEAAAIDANDALHIDYAELDEFARTHKGTIAPGEYLIGSALAPNLVLDVVNGSSANQANIQIFTDNGTNAQRWRVSEDENGYLQITNLGSGKCLDVAGASAMAGANVWQYESNGTRAQKWIAVQTESGIVLYSALGGNLVLDVQSAGIANGTNVQVYSDNGSMAQQFHFFQAGGLRPSERSITDGTYTISCSGLSLDMQGASLENGGRAQAYESNGSLAQSFYISFDEKAGFYTIRAAHSGLLLDADNGSFVPGALVSQWGDAASGMMQRYWSIVQQMDGTFVITNAANAQVLSFSAATSSSSVVTLPANEAAYSSWVIEESNFAWSQAEMDEWARSDASCVGDGEYILEASVGQRKVVDVASASKADGANVWLYESNGTKAQRWRVEALDDGYVRLTSVESGKVLDVAAAMATNGTNVQQYSWNETRAQKWLPVSDGEHVTLYSALGRGLVLDVSGGLSQNGTNVDIYSYNGTAAQKFAFVDCNPMVPSCPDYGLDGWYEIATSVNADYVVDVANGSTADGANVQLYRANQTMAQLFEFEYSDGWYLIRNALGGVLDVTDGNPVPGTNVQQWSGSSDNRNQQWSIISNDDGTYNFINRATGLALDVAGGAASNCVNVQVYTSNDSAAQRFFLQHRVNLLPEGVFEIRSALSSQQVLDVAAGSAMENANVQIYSSNNSPAQKWSVALVEGQENVYTLQSLASGLYLGIDDAGNVCQKPVSSEDAILWRAHIANGAYVLENMATGKVLDVEGASTASGTNVQVYERNGTDAQGFEFVSTDVLSEGTYVVRSALDSTMVLDVKNGSLEDYANVQLFTSNDTGAQKWNVLKNDDGSFTFENCASGKALDVLNANASNGANVQQYESNSSAAQKWFVTWDSNAGGYVFSSALNTSYVLDVADASIVDGSNIQLYEANGSKAQAFTLLPTTYVPTGQALMTEKAQRYISNTGWLIMVDTTSNYLGLYTGHQGDWDLYQYWICSTGAFVSPTVLGEFIVTGRGYSFGHGYTCYYYTQFFGDYLIHSVKYFEGTFVVMDGRMGMNISEGCARLPIEQAKWIYDNIPNGTKVVTYA